MRVLKFGGSSVGTSERIKNVASIITTRHEKFDKICVVVSAYQGVTDRLIEIIKLAARGEQKYKELL